ncbi:hypothetical protein PVK06_019353 [Gossypium arboreum]|uniref:Uncharacterized protein n=1 Tax=Gossypium arboreum TaxID=29729 RepID=A0ABR0PJH5_GOSAR|nr:hypothetical protein PVK06_019353 [Gossypium arboreum]
MMPKNGFDLKSNVLMVVLILIRKKINALKSERFSDARSLPDDELDFLQQVLDVVTNLGSQWIIRKYGSHSCQREYLKPVAKEIHDCAKKKAGSAYFPLLITSLCLRARVKTQANLKGRYVQRSITNYDLERLVEKVHELNQDTKEEESDKESYSPKPVEGFENPDPRVELEEEPVRLSVEPEPTTPMLTSASASNAIFETWTEDTDYASRDGAEKDKGNESKK